MLRTRTRISDNISFVYDITPHARFGCHRSTAHFMDPNHFRSGDNAIGSMLTLMGKTDTRLFGEEPA